MIKLGIDNIDSEADYFRNKRVGLITNPTGLDSRHRSTIDVLQEKTNLTCLFAPEHGVRGHLQAGVRFESEVDAESGIMTYSLYTKDKKPTKAMMDLLDVLCIDIQDAGSRFYTYIYTMAHAMMACKEYDKEFVVFDRPNPVNGTDYEGNILDLNYRSFVGYYPILQRHGLTIGELALLFNVEYGIGCKLHIVKMTGWKRDAYYDETGLLWVIPSPNLPTIEACVLYNATCIFEGTNISEGRGTTLPFELVGAPFINGLELENKLNALKLPGVYFRRHYFTPTFSKHADVLCSGVQVHVLSRKLFKPVMTGWAMLDVIRHLYPGDFKILPPYKKGGNCMLQYNTGCNYITEDKYPLSEQFAILERDRKEFAKIREKYLLYEE